MAPEGAPYAKAWLAKAAGDLYVARSLLADPDAPRWSVGFHLQQAAEKALKALFTLRAEVPPRTHHLDELCEILSAAQPEIAGWADRLLPLEVFSVSERYPAETAEADVDWTAALRSVEKLLDLVRAKTGTD